MKQIDTQTIHHEIDTLNQRQLEEVGNFIGYLKSLSTEDNKPSSNMDAIRERLEKSAQSGDLIPLEQAFKQIVACM